MFPEQNPKSWSMEKTHISVDADPMHIHPDCWQRFLDGIAEKRKGKTPMKFLDEVVDFCKKRAHDKATSSPDRPSYAPQDTIKIRKVWRYCCTWKEKGCGKVKKVEIQKAWAVIWPKDPTTAELKKAEDPGNKSKIGKLE